MESIMNVLQSVSIIIASGVAIYGINAWKREYIGKKRLELAEEVLETFFAIKDAIEHVRLPLAWSSEGTTRDKSPNETEEDTNILNQAHIVFERFDKYRETFSRFAALKYHFMVVFGKEQESIFKDIFGIRSDLLSASRMLISDWKNGKGGMNDTNRILIKKWESANRIHRGKKDSIQDNIEAVQKKLEEIAASCLTETTCWEKIKRFILAAR
ncbi:MAG: hypothetical protein ABSA77_07350 [Thermoguttaceae bacterium]|jgi:hypothetical protein